MLSSACCVGFSHPNHHPCNSKSAIFTGIYFINNARVDGLILMVFDLQGSLEGAVFSAVSVARFICPFQKWSIQLDSKTPSRC